MEFSKYLFCYFTGNRPEEESVHFALSQDGYHFNSLNSNEPVIKQQLGRKCARDPFIFRDNDGMFHIIATDMRCYDGWNSNNSMVMWDSADLINWENERIFDFSQFEATKNADRVWAPQIIYDKFEDAYMIYWSHNNTDDELSTVTWYIYTRDFVSFITEPKLLFKPKSNLAGIDGDMIEYNGKYYLYIADEGKDAVCYAVSDKPSGPFYEPDDNKVSVAKTAIEGNCMYKVLGSDKYVMIADRFKNGGYFMQEGTDLLHFTEVEKDSFSIDHIKARHGSMLHITDSEYERLASAFGIDV